MLAEGGDTLEAAKAAWERRAEQARRLEYEFKFTYPSLGVPGMAQRPPTTGRIVRYNDDVLVHIHDSKYDEKRELVEFEWVVGQNPYYTFSLSRRAGRSEFTAQHIGPPNSRVSALILQATFSEDYAPKFTYSLPNTPLTDVGVRTALYEFAAGVDGPNSVLRWNFTMDNPVKKNTVVKTEVFLSPERNFRVNGFTALTEFVKATGTVRYRQSGDRDIPEQYVFVYQNLVAKGGPTPDERYVCDVTRWDELSTPPPESVFRVTQFGFPEPEGVPTAKSPPWPLYVWLLIAAAAAAVIAGVVRVTFRRRSTRRLPEGSP
jgi:hypothetical protein